MLSDKTLRFRAKARHSNPARFLLLVRCSDAMLARRRIEIAAMGTSGSMKNISQIGSCARFGLPVPS